MRCDLADALVQKLMEQLLKDLVQHVRNNEGSLMGHATCLALLHIVQPARVDLRFVR